MKRTRLLFSLSVFLGALVIFGCNGASNMSSPVVPGSSAMTFTMTDTPPMGVTILSFEVTLTGATLNPGSVDLLAGKGPIRIEVRKLETDSAFLNTTNVAPGTYTSINLTFSNPEATFKNDTGATLAGCAVGAVCEIKPSGTLTSTVTLAGSGLMVFAGAPTGLQVDVNPNTILTSAMGVDFSLAGAASAQQLMGRPEGEMDDVDDLRGAVQGLNAASKTFTLHTMDGDFPITTDSKTEFDFEACMANDFTCVQNNQVVEVDAKLMAGGVFLARKIGFEDGAEDDEVDGVIFKIDDATHFEMVVLGELRAVNNVNVGNPTVVTLSSPSFQVKAENLQVPAGLQSAFEGATDTAQLLTGQVVQVRVNSMIAGPPITITTNRVRLRGTQFTATVSGAPAPPNFTVGTLPALFTNAGISAVHVQTSSKTNFQGVTDVTGLADGNTVSLRGLLFKNGANPPELIAKKVRKR